MKSHELAHKLLLLPDLEVTASTDISNGEDDAFKRAFGDELDSLDYGVDDRITLLFSSGYINE